MHVSFLKGQNYIGHKYGMEKEYTILGFLCIHVMGVFGGNILGSKSFSCALFGVFGVALVMVEQLF